MKKTSPEKPSKYNAFRDSETQKYYVTFSFNVISGHERIQTTLDTYGHLYPNAQAEVAKQLEEFMSGH